MLNKNLALVVLVVFAAGCGTEVRTYVMTKNRVGLDRGNGNGGCVVGTCPPPAAPAETTRKVYVLEITKPVPESEVRKIEETAANAIVDTQATPSTPQAAQAAVVPSENTQNNNPAPNVRVGELPGSETISSEATPAPAGQNNGNVQPPSTYTVQKDDTLQKISKKVYGTYTKWYRLYKANRDKISNPNVLRAGTVLTVPPLK